MDISEVYSTKPSPLIKSIDFKTGTAEVIPSLKLKGYQQLLKMGQNNLEVIKTFGRYPARNKALGRENTPAEFEYLKLLFGKNSKHKRSNTQQLEVIYRNRSFVGFRVGFKEINTDYDVSLKSYEGNFYQTITS